MSSLPGSDHDAYEFTRRKWEDEYSTFMADEKEIRNRSGLKIKPLYTPDSISNPAQARKFSESLGFPGQYPYTRGVYSTMHRGRRWSQRQLIGLSSPEAFNKRQHQLLASGSAAVSLIPCNSCFRGLDMDDVPRAILGTCGTLVNTVEDIEICLDEIPLEKSSIGLNDPTPFTFAAFVLSSARKRGISWEQISGTSNQSDYLSHYVANHMFFRLALPGSRRVLGDHMEFMLEKVPRWNPLSVVGQHMQQAGATPAEAMAFTLCSAIQYAEDCRKRGMAVDDYLPRFSFFFDISISFFEEIAKFRAGRRIWAKIARERFGATTEAAMRLRFHAQTSGADLTRQQPMNNISRVAIQGMAGILGGLQSLHTDAWDEALSSPTEQSARLASATQNILSNEAGLADVIDPLGGSYYIEHLTDEMENKIESIITEVDNAGGMYQAVQTGLIQSWIGRSSLQRQQEIDQGDQKIVGVNLHQVEESAEDRHVLERPSEAEIDRCLERLKTWKASRSQDEVSRELSKLARVAEQPSKNVFAQVIESAAAGATHGEIVHCLRDVLGFGQPRVQV